jgi:hypothetical protein
MSIDDLLPRDPSDHCALCSKPDIAKGTSYCSGPSGALICIDCLSAASKTLRRRLRDLLNALEAA